MTQAGFSYGPIEDATGLVASVAIFADGAMIRSEMASDLVGAGLRLSRSGTLDELLDGDPGGLGDIVLIECPQIDAKATAGLARLDMRIAQTGAQLIVSTSMQALDAVFASFDQCAPQILVDATRSERIVAIGRTLGAISGVRLRELSESERLALLRLSQQVDAIAKRIEGLSGQPLFSGNGQSGTGRLADRTNGFKGFDGDTVFTGLNGKKPSLPAPQLVRRHIEMRQLRGKFFDAELFADPAWDMLLDLTASEGEGHRVSVTSLCIASGVPPTTALRWVRQMTESGIFTRVDDPDDGRRAFISLSAQSREAMARYFAAVEAPAKVAEAA